MIQDLEKIGMLRRFNQNGKRFYACQMTDSIAVIPSVTTVIDTVIPMSFVQRKMIAEMGLERYNQFMKERAEYGTLLHIWAQSYFNYNEMEIGDIMDNFYGGRLPEYARVWLNDLLKDAMSIYQWSEDCEVVPLLVEFPVLHVGLGIAGMVDLLCELNIEEKGYFGETYKSGERKGEPKESKRTKRVRAIVDFKSGKSGFYRSHEIQLLMYRIAYSAMVQGVGEEEQQEIYIFNVAPKDWRGEIPTYSMKDQSDSAERANVFSYLNIARNLPELQYKDEEIVTQTGKGVRGLRLVKNSISDLF